MTDTADTRRAVIVDAFTTRPLTGNAAGVVPDATGLATDQLRAVAGELGASETAFLTDETDDSDADRRVRYFTPTREVDLCGHATIASYAHLFADGAVEAGTHALETNVGVLEVEVTSGGVVWMTQEPPTAEPVEVDYGRLGDALGVDAAALSDVGADLPVARASTGLPFLVVPVNFLEHLGTAAPDAAAVEALSEEHDVAGVYAFTFDTLEADATLHARAWAPAIGVSEDPVTGTASGACGGYLEAVGAFEGSLPDELTFEQGHFLDRPGRVRVRVDGDVVRVGGRAVTALDGTVAIPASDAGDGIIEA